MKVLVTGAAGFIGSHLAEQLAKNKFDVVGIDNFNDYYCADLKRLNAKEFSDLDVHIIEHDLRANLESVLPKDLDYVFHLAAQPGISQETSFTEYVDNNINATQNLLNFLQVHNKPLRCFVNIATSSIYGIEATFPEDQEPNPISNYSKTKLKSEQLVLDLQRQGKLNACSLRLYSVYGPRERPEKLYSKLIKSIFENTSFPLHKGSLEHSRSFTYVGDIVSGLISCIGREKQINGEVINIGSDREYTTRQGIELVEKIIGKSANLEEIPPRHGDQLRTTAIIDKARELLDYEPKTSFEDGIKAQVEWYRKNFVSTMANKQFNAKTQS